MSLFTEQHDPHTCRQLAELGVGPGWRCADVGAGDGSIARWLIGRVAPGHVVAYDLDDAPLRAGVAGTGVEVVSRDLTREGFAPESFDLVHSRLLLCYLTECEVVLSRMVEAVAVGGWVALSDLDFTVQRPGREDARWTRVWSAFLRSLREAGWDPAFGRRLHRLLEGQKLVSVRAESLGRYVRGGSPACEMTSRALANAVPVLEGVDAEEVAEVQALLADDSLGFFAPTFVMAVGRRPP